MRRIFPFIAICFLAAVAQAQDSTRPDTPQQSPALAQPESPKLDQVQPGAESVVAIPSGPQLRLRDGRPVQSPPAPLHATSYERHSQMRRERDEEFVVLLCRLSGKLKECPVWNWGSADGLAPLTLEMKNVDGLTVRYREGPEYVSEPDGTPAHTSEGLEAFRLKVRAAKDFPLGATTLEGKVTFQRVQDGKLSAPETIAISIPVMVVKHDTQVTESYWGAIETPKRNPLAPLGNALLYVVAAPILLPFIIGCSIHSNCE